MVTAPVRTDRIADLRMLLATMNRAPGIADPANALVPFGRFDTIHVARFVVTEDNTLEDRRYFPGSPPGDRVHLVFMADCDGPGEELMAWIVRESGSGLRRIFAHCDNFDDNTELLGWMRAHQTPPTAI